MNQSKRTTVLKSISIKSKQKQVDLKAIFGSLQDSLMADLKVSKTAVKHSGTQGTVTEQRWRKMFEEHLPSRYCATEAMVVDSTGAISEQIDLVIYDRHYSPFILNQGAAKYVTAESVYAVFEIKPTLNATTLEYAAKKVASVRALQRTSARIPHAGGVHRPKRLTDILGGILAVGCSWKGDLRKSLAPRLAKCPRSQRLDLGCVLAGRSFDARYHKRQVKLLIAEPDSSLVFFLLNLLSRLQALGTVAAIDLRTYANRL
jgi:hypothetical protein